MKRLLTILLSLSGVVFVSTNALAKEEKLYIAIQDNPNPTNSQSFSQAELLKPIEPAVDPAPLQIAIEEANQQLQSPGSRLGNLNINNEPSLVEPLCLDPCPLVEYTPADRPGGVGVQWPVK